jgi:hypothetical protein
MVVSMLCRPGGPESRAWRLPLVTTITTTTVERDFLVGPRAGLWFGVHRAVDVHRQDGVANGSRPATERT